MVSAARARYGTPQQGPGRSLLLLRMPPPLADAALAVGRRSAAERRDRTRRGRNRRWRPRARCSAASAICRRKARAWIKEGGGGLADKRKLNGTRCLKETP